MRTFPISVVLLAPDLAGDLDRTHAAHLVELLESRFRDSEDIPLFHFRLHRFTRANDSMPCAALRSLGDRTSKPAHATVLKAFDDCDDHRLADRGTIVLYLFRTSDPEEIDNSYIYHPVTQPFAFINVARLDDKWSVLEHEVGHAFGLPEVPACGSTPTTATDPMGHVMDFCSGTGGDRSLGFAKWEVALIRTTAPFVAHKLARGMVGQSN